MYFQTHAKPALTWLSQVCYLFIHTCDKYICCRCSIMRVIMQENKWSQVKKYSTDWNEKRDEKEERWWRDRDETTGKIMCNAGEMNAWMVANEKFPHTSIFQNQTSICAGKGNKWDETTSLVGRKEEGNSWDDILHSWNLWAVVKVWHCQQGNRYKNTLSALFM